MDRNLLLFSFVNQPNKIAQNKTKQNKTKHTHTHTHTHTNKCAVIHFLIYTLQRASDLWKKMCCLYVCFFVCTCCNFNRSDTFLFINTCNFDRSDTFLFINICCNFDRSDTFLGSSLKSKMSLPLEGIMSSDCSINPDFCMWHMVDLVYCDGSSFLGGCNFLKCL